MKLAKMACSLPPADVLFFGHVGQKVVSCCIEPAVFVSKELQGAAYRTSVSTERRAVRGRETLNCCVLPATDHGYNNSVLGPRRGLLTFFVPPPLPRPTFRASSRTRWRGGSLRARAWGPADRAGEDRLPSLTPRRPLLGGEEADRRPRRCRPRCPDEGHRCPGGRELVLRGSLER